MTLSRLLTIVGTVLIVFGLISGINYYYSSSRGISEFSYSFNAGKVIVGTLLIYIGNRLKPTD